ncbi:type VI secretion system PAAR protein [Marinobacter sp. ATCH36]|uniref:type VI secretion system PAAR protein n=1 Tax=Marinobacter sp. ATCH36 TaxID=2945106 RepID=UPI00202221FF|nr:type VI secretion system PAAR protein [Marinobacter sp. ATCH36]MCL7943662.1 type VI secretion system PAAR protein [Marinobacter sp. ATCH36]
MSKKVVLLGDMGTDHQGFPPTPVTAGSPDVLIDGKPVARVGDPLAPHSKPKHPPHPRAIAAGSATVLINGIPAAVTGGAISCGGVTIGSGSVVIGDTYTSAPFSGVSPAPPKAARRAEASFARSADGGLAESPGSKGFARGVDSVPAGGAGGEAAGEILRRSIHE